MLPILYQSPDLVIYSYPLLMGLGWGVGYQVFMHGLPPSFPRLLSQLIFWGLFVSAWVGSKLFFLITQPINIKLAQDLSFWTGGGFVFYGGLIMGAFFLIPIKVMKPHEFSVALEKLLPALLVGHAIGRIGCFLAGCCYGRITRVFWAVHQHDEYRHPSQLYEAFGLTLLAYLLLNNERWTKNYLVFYLMGYGILRLIVEHFRGDEIRGSWWGMPPSAALSLILLAMGMFLYNRKKSKA